jgi:pyridoxal 5''-phosphate synthase, glutaminase subunit Pdx2
MDRVGVLSLQGDYAAHAAAIERAGGSAFEARTVADIESAQAMILPGGESTVIGALLMRFGLMDTLVRRVREGMPVLGTCAGLILLAARIEGREQPGLRLLDLELRRNAYGRQVESFRAPLSTSIPGINSIEGVFIRAPMILSTGESVEVLARHEGSPVLVRQGKIVGATFHPELVEAAPIHRWFLQL